MFEVAEMLGVRIGEYFDIDTKEGKFVFDNAGLYSMHAKVYSPYILFQLLTGELGIKPQSAKAWKPKFGDAYYSIGPGGVLEPGTWLSDFIDLAMYKLGNCYCTTEEAEAHADKWKAFYASDDILEV
jgi:hypothetical protein